MTSHEYNQCNTKRKVEVYWKTSARKLHLSEVILRLKVKILKKLKY